MPPRSFAVTLTFDICDLPFEMKRGAVARSPVCCSFFRQPGDMTRFGSPNRDRVPGQPLRLRRRCHDVEHLGADCLKHGLCEAPSNPFLNQDVGFYR